MLVAAVIAIVVAVYYGEVAKHTAPVVVKAPTAPPPVSTTITSSGSAPVTNNTASGQGSQAGSGNQGGSGNVQGSGNIVSNGSTTISPVVLPSPLPGMHVRRTITTTTVVQKVFEEYYTDPKMSPAKAKTSKQKRIAINFNIAIDQLQAGDAAASIRSNTRVIAIDAKNAAAFNSRAVGEFALGQYKAAWESWRSAIRLDPSNLEYKQNFIKGVSRGHAHVLLIGVPSITAAVQIYNEAFAQARLLIQDQPRSPVGYTWMSELQIQFADLPRMLAALPQQSVGHITEPVGLTAATETIQRAIKNNAVNDETMSCLGQILFERGQFEKSIKVYKEVLAHSPKSSSALLGIAHSQASIGDNRNAIANLTMAIGIDPSLVVNLRPPLRGWGSLPQDPKFQALAASAGESDQ